MTLPWRLTAALATVAMLLGVASPAQAAAPKDFHYSLTTRGDVLQVTVHAAGKAYKLTATPAKGDRSADLKISYTTSGSMAAFYDFKLQDAAGKTLLTSKHRAQGQAMYGLGKFLPRISWPRTVGQLVYISQQDRDYWTSADRFDGGRNTFASRATLLTYARAAFGISKTAGKSYWARQVRLNTQGAELVDWVYTTKAELPKLTSAAAREAYLNRTEQLTMPNYEGQIDFIGDDEGYLIIVSNTTDDETYTYASETNTVFVSRA